MTRKAGNTTDKNGAKTAQNSQKKDSPEDAYYDRDAPAAMKVKQAAFLKALPLARFNISAACAEAGIARKTFYWWKDNDPAFRETFEEVLEARIDKWEECLHKNILAGSETSVIFALKTKGRKRGYTEKEVQSEKVVAILGEVLAGTLTEREAAYRITMLGEPLPKVLEIALRAKQEDGDTDIPKVPTSPDALDRAYEDAIAARDEQQELFLPQRVQEVDELKQELKLNDSFAPGAGDTAPGDPGDQPPQEPF